MLFKKELPVRYSVLTDQDRYEVREQYHKIQKGRCWHCGSPVGLPPPDWIEEKRIDWDLFPENFLHYPIHLHHDHNTDLTVGIVHARCNAVLWQYHGE